MCLLEKSFFLQSMGGLARKSVLAGKYGVLLWKLPCETPYDKQIAKAAVLKIPTFFSPCVLRVWKKKKKSNVRRNSQQSRERSSNGILLRGGDETSVGRGDPSPDPSPRVRNHDSPPSSPNSGKILLLLSINVKP